VYAWTKPACVGLAWSILTIIIIVVAAGMTGPTRPVQANIRIASSSTQVTLASTLSAAAAPGLAAGPAARYVVQPGDTLSGIAARFAVRGGWPALYAANRPLIGPDPDLIRPGTVLVLPGQRAPVRYRVVPGDTLAAIAAALAVRGGWPALYAANRQVIGPDPDLIRPGTVLTVPRPAPPPAVSSPAPRRYPPEPSSGPAGSGHRPLPRRTGAPGRGGMPSWLKILLLAAGLLIGAAFLAEPVLVIRRRRRITTRAAAGTAAGPGQPPASGPPPAAVPARRLASGPPAAGRTRIVVADYPRVVVTRSTGDDTVCVLRPPGQDPAAILKAARLVLPEGPYRELARQLGLPASWPIVLADYDRLVVTCSARDGSVCVLRPPGQDPAAILRAARLVLPEDPYEELAELLGVSASWPPEQRCPVPPG
jgi:LysM repeat protein